MAATAVATRPEPDLDLEVWENSTAGRVVLEKFNQTGSLVAEMVGGHRTVHLSSKERRINQEKAATSEQDVFQNGILQPRRLNADEPDAAVLMANPNVITEPAMRALFAAKATPSKPTPFQDRLATITHAPVLNRLLEMAVEVDASLSQYQAIQGRLDEIAPLMATEIVSAGTGEARPSRPVTPR